MTAAIIILGWLACVVGAYLACRRVARLEDDKWTAGARVDALCLAVMLGPLALIVALCCWLDLASKSEEAAKW